ncbi:hypothetical protein ACT3CD_14795 [Geofilum sp. OHC36d9]|uniref:hypothetical protein n=1 Tax=Geofilum sp. OHC36d9 TaxID=3458413 RepID=UPI004033EA5D
MKKDNIFWISYSDLMTSLFFVMLVLFVVTIGYLKNQMFNNEELITQLREKEQETETLITELKTANEKLIITVKQQDKLLKIEEQFKPLEESGKFIYLPNCKKYLVKDLLGQEIFEPNKSVIKRKFVSTTINIGYEIEDFLKDLYMKTPELSYLLVIEGNMANTYDRSYSVDNKYGYKKSFERALAVYDLWNKNNIDLRKYNTEIMLCGSGFNGLCRDNLEENNKRFSIQIIPKVQNRSN